MNHLDLPSYIKIMQKAFVTHDKQEAAFGFVMNSINEQDYVLNNGYGESYGSTKVTRIMKREAPVPDGTKLASSNPSVTSEVIRHFKDVVEKDINPHSGDDSIKELVTLIDNDETIPEIKRNFLKATLKNDDRSAFLAETFLYALNRDFRTQDEPVSTDDIPLLAEANYRCPICHKPLIDTVKGIPVKRYKIVRIFPEGLDSSKEKEFTGVYPSPNALNRSENLIALDKDCAEEYELDPTVDEYKKLIEIKQELSRNYALNNELDVITLEKDIRAVVEALSNISEVNMLTQLSFDVLKIEQKMGTSDFILLKQVQMQVVQYYNYIRELFSNSESNFMLISSEVKTASKKLENAGLNNAEVIERLSKWFMDQSGLGIKSKPACDIVVAFFIQDCEVFSE